MYLYLLILLQLLSSAGASESGIVGGKIAKPHSRPYMVSLQHRGYRVCGGMLIREDFVLTSAHCLEGAYPLTVVLGAHDLTEEEKKSRQEIQVVHHHRHPLHRQYSQHTYDIMLLQGDSGGPLICNNKAQGIVAFNYPKRCDNSQYPHVYMKIPFFMPWIKEVLHGYGDNMSLNKQE
ncbi:granzyme H-like [Salvelinus namaycush]|uniref:trypsin n=1 Tax=Salvelinus namaycush TaxID=8040 RepID=A0A8U1ESH7_SALNM|nr:granzyme H-like [Salvelinus namaycush]